MFLYIRYGGNIETIRRISRIGNSPGDSMERISNNRGGKKIEGIPTRENLNPTPKPREKARTNRKYGRYRTIPNIHETLE